MEEKYSKSLAKAKIVDISVNISITPKKFLQCLGVTRSNTERVQLVLAFLSSVHGMPTLEMYIEEIKKNFLIYNFSETNKLIKQILHNPEIFIANDSLVEWTEAIDKAIKNFGEKKTYPIIFDTNPRRMFESILGQRYLHSDNTLKDLNNYYENIKNTNDLTRFISVHLFLDEDQESQKAWYYWDINRHRIYTNIDRGRSDKRKSDEFAPKVRTPGVLKSTTPRPMYMYDREIFYDGRASQADLNIIKKSCSSANWVNLNPENPFVASFSGHTIYFLGLIRAKCVKYFPKQDRQKYFDTMIKAFISVYLSQGFHSLKEIFYMIQDSLVDASFKDIGVNIDLAKLFIYDKDIFEKVLIDSIEYNTTYLLRRSIQIHFENLQKVKQDLDLGLISPEKAVDNVSPYLIVHLALVENPNLLNSFSMDFIKLIYSKNYIKDNTIDDSLVLHRLSKENLKMNFSNFKDKNIIVQRDFYKLQLSCLKNDVKNINQYAKDLFSKACVKRRIIFKNTFSTDTSSAQSLIKLLQKPDNAYILEALEINPNDDSTIIRNTLIELMKKAYNNEDVISLTDKTQLSNNTPPQKRS